MQFQHCEELGIFQQTVQDSIIFIIISISDSSVYSTELVPTIIRRNVDTCFYAQVM